MLLFVFDPECSPFVVDEIRSFARVRGLELRERERCASDDGLLPVSPVVVVDNGDRVSTTLRQLAERFDDPLFSDSRTAVLPVELPEIFALYKKAVASFWTSDEVALHDDKAAFQELSGSEQHLVKHVLGFFSQADAIVMRNIKLNFLDELAAPEIRMFLVNQAFMEAEHSLMYALLIDALIDDPTERRRVLDAVKTMPAVGAKQRFAERWLDSTRSFAERLVGFACVEGILFSSSFAFIYWLKTRRLVPGLNLSNEFISRDEAMHVEHAAAVYKRLRLKLAPSEFHEIVRDAVVAEASFVRESVPEALVGMNADVMTQYVRFVADGLCRDFGVDAVYGASNPFEFMKNLGLRGKTNFFEGRPSDYQRATLADIDDGDDDDF